MARGRAGRSRLHLPEQCFVRLADRQRLGAPLQVQFDAAAEVALHARDLGHVDDDRAVHLPEPLGVEFLRELAHRLADQRLLVLGDDPVYISCQLVPLSV